MKAIITRNDQTAVLELPSSRMALAGSLSRIGVRTPAYIIPCSDEEEDYIKVKLFGESDFENELTALVTPKDSLGSVNTALDLYRELPQTQKEKLNVELSQNPPDSLSSLCHKVMDFQPKYVTEDYYFPLTVTVYEYNEYGDLDYDSDCELDGRFADDYADEIKAMFDAYTASDRIPVSLLSTARSTWSVLMNPFMSTSAPPSRTRATAFCAASSLSSVSTNVTRSINSAYCGSFSTAWRAPTIIAVTKPACNARATAPRVASSSGHTTARRFTTFCSERWHKSSSKFRMLFISA